MIRLLLVSALAIALAGPAAAQTAPQDALAACATPGRWMDEVLADFERRGWVLLTEDQVPNAARLQAAIDVIDRAQREGWAAELSASPLRAEAEVANWADYLAESLSRQVRSGMPAAVPPYEYATLLASGGGVLTVTTSPEFNSMDCVLRGIWKGGSEAAIGGVTLRLGAGPHHADAHYTSLQGPGWQGSATMRFYDLEMMAQASHPAAGQAFVMTVEAARNQVERFHVP